MKEVVEQDRNGTERKEWKGLLLVNRDIGMSVYKKDRSKKRSVECCTVLYLFHVSKQALLQQNQ